MGLLAKYDTRKGALGHLKSFLVKSRDALGALPDSNGRAGLFGLTEYLVRQSEELGVVA